MKTIKLTKFGNYKITPNALKNVPIAENKSEKESFITNLKKKESAVLLAFNQTELKFDFLLQIKDNDRILASMFYDPILTFFKQAYDTNNKANQAKSNFRIAVDNDDIKIVDMRDFSVFMQLKLNSIIMLQTAIEAFINSVIPEESFVYKNKKKSKKQIERELSFKDKLKFLSDTIENFNIQKKEDKETYDLLLKLNSIRQELVHMKTNKEEMFEPFIESLRNALGYDLDKQFDYCITFMNKIKPDFIELIDMKK